MIKKITALLFLFVFAVATFAANDCLCWIDEKTGEVVPTIPRSAVYAGEAVAAGLRKTELKLAPMDDENHIHNPKTGQSFVRVPCPEEKPNTPANAVKTAAAPAAKANDLFQLSLGYNFMRTAQEDVKDLHGFQVSGFYNVNSWLAVGGEFSGLYGSQHQGYYDVSLDRYLYLFGPQVTFQPCEKVKVVGHVLFGGVTDQNGYSSAFGSGHSSANAFAMAVGVGVDVQVTQRITVGPVFDYTPTAFSAPTGNWQNNWSVGVAGKISF